MSITLPAKMTVPARAAVPPPPVPLHDDQQPYIALFGKFDSESDKLTALVKTIKTRADDQQRLYASIECIEAQHRLMLLQQDILVELANYIDDKLSAPAPS